MLNNNVKILAIGAASQDVFLSGKDIAVERDEQKGTLEEVFPLGAKLNIEEVVFATGGGATNAAVTFARQGLESSFIGKIGRDPAGKAVLAELDAEHVYTGLVLEDAIYGTQYSTVLLAAGGERTILIYRGAAHDHQVSDYEKIDFNEFEWLYISSLAGKLDVLDTIVTRAKAAGVKIALNPGDGELKQPDKVRALLEDIEVLVLNREEGAMLVDGVSSEEVARSLSRLVPIAVVSDGPNGVVATDGKEIVSAGMYEDVPVVDRTGAGDAFGSGFVSQIAQGKTLQEAIVFASANSTSVVGLIGAKAGILHVNTSLHEMPLETKPY